MNKPLKLKIIEKFGSQAEFATSLGVDESVVSRVLHGRRKLQKDQAIAWGKVLDCGIDVFEPAIREAQCSNC